MQYQDLFNLKITHTYYQDNVCPDFSCLPTDACTRMLRNHRLLLKNTKDGIRVLVAKLDDGSTFYSPSDNLKFSFYLVLSNPDFTLFTDLSKSIGIANQGLLKKPVFIYNTDFTNTDLQAQEYQNQEGNTFNRSGDVFALVEIRDSALAIGSPKTYTISFETYTAPWKYYLLSDIDEGYEVLDTSIERNPLYNFIQIPPEEGDSYQALLLEKYADKSVQLFKSTTDIPLTEKGVKNLSLNKDSDSLIANLPNPEAVLVPDDSLQLIQTIFKETNS